MSDDLNWKAWFKAWGDQNSLHVACRVGPGGLRTAPEEMYQAFKARLIDELQVHGETKHGDSIHGHLEDLG